MSTVIDQRVVEMRFDNKHFENNVSTTMSTLDKLKQKLNLSGAAKGLDSINTSAKNVNMSGLGNAVESVSAKFSALQVMGVTALANITNSAVNAGKRIASALTIDPIKTGFSEYETQINAVQTILANTQSKGTTLSDVNKALDELNAYADKTIYNFTEMTRNIGTFTAAGIDLDTSVNAIQGIANLAAVSGSTSQQASTAMYQLSQALASGTVKLMDWNSVVNAGMGGQVFQDALKETARVHGIAIDQMIDEQGSFRETLQEGWLTSEILTETLQKFTLTTEGLTKEQIEANREMLRAKGYTEEQIDGIFKLGNTATNAATKVKTFTQLWDVLKEAAQSGWSRTWKLIIGDFEEAKSLLTPLADFLTGIINKMSDWRNAIIEKAMASPFGKLAEKLGKVTGAVETVTDAVKNYEKIADRIIGGEFGNGQTRWDKLSEMGYDWAKAQNIVNERLGSSVKHTEQLGDAQKKQSEAQATTIEQLVKMNDAQLESLGFTKDEIKAFRELEEQSKKTGIPIEELAKDLDQLSGRNLLINSFKNIGKAIGEVVTTVKTAWQEIFPPKSIDERAKQLYDLIAALHKFTTGLGGLVDENGKLTDTGDKLARTLKGVFAILDIIATVAGGGLKIAFNILRQVLSYFDMDILGLTANIGDAIVGFRDWIDSVLDVSGALDIIVPVTKDAIKSIKAWFNAFKETPAVQRLVKVIESIKSAFEKLTSGEINISEFASSLGTGLAEALKSLPGIAAQVASDFIAGFLGGLGSSVSGVITKVISFALDFVAAFAAALGVESPSWKAYEIAVDFFQGAINGAKSMISNVLGVFKVIGEQIVKVFKSFWDYITDESGNIEWDKIFAGGILISIAWFLKQLATAFSGIAGALGGLDDIFDEAGKVIKKFGKVLNAYAWDLKASALQKLAISIGILAAAVFVLAQIEDPAQLWNAVGVIAALAGIVALLALAMSKLSDTSLKLEGKKLNIEGIKSGLMQIGIVILLLAASVKLIGSMDPEAAKQGFKGLAGLAVGLIAFMAAMGGISRYSKDLGQIGGLLLKLSIAMMLMVGVIKLVNGLSPEEMGKGVVFAAAFVLFVNAITRVAKSSGNNVSKVGGMILKLSIAMGLMVGVCKLASMLSVKDMLKGAAFAAGFVIFIKSLVSCTQIGKKQQLAKVSGMVLSVSFSLTLMVGVCKLVGKLSGEEMLKGALFVAGFTVMLKTLMTVLSIGSEQKMAKVSGTILAMATAIAILAAVAVALSFVPLEGLAKGVIAVGLLGLVMTGMISALKGAQNVKGSIMMMAIAIAVMAGAIVALSFIDPSDLAGASIALTMVMGMFALIEKCSKDVNASLLSLGAMIVAVGLLSGILYLLSSNIDDADSAIKVAISLGILLGALATSMKIAGSIKATSGLAMGSMFAMVGVLALVAAVVGVLEYLDVAPSIETAISLSVLLMALAGVTAVLTLVGAGAPAALGGIAAFAIVVAGVGAVMLALAGLNYLLPDLETWLDTGITILEKIGAGIGKFVGGFLGGIGEGMMDSLLEMVETFKSVMEALVEVSEIGTGINTEGFDGLGELIKALAGITLTGAGMTITDIFTSLFSGQTTIEKFQSDCVAFFGAMKAISEASTGVTVDEAAMDAVIGVAQKLADLQSSLEPIGGVISWFTGKDDLATFGANVGEFITSMKTALSGLEGVTLNTEALNPIIAATRHLAGLQSSLEPIGGVIQFFTGRDDLATFGTNVGEFISSMKTALSSLEGFTFNGEALSVIITAAQDLSKLQSSLEPIDSVIQFFTGRDDLSTFGVDVSSFISSMKTALSTLEGATLDPAALASVIDAATQLSSLQAQLEPMGGVISWFSGRTDLGTFGINIALFASAMGTLKTAMGESGISDEVITSISNAGNAIIALQDALPEEGWFDGKMNLSEFSDYITDFGTAMGTFGATAAEIDTTAVNTAITAAGRIRYLIESLAGLDTSGLATFTGVGTGGFGADGAAYKIAQAISAYSEEVADIDVGTVSTSVTAALKLKSLIAGLSGLDSSGVSNFKPDTVGNAIKKYNSSVSGVDMSAVGKSISAANRLKNFISSLSGFSADGVGSFKAAIDELSTVNVAGLVAAFSGASTKLASAGASMIDGLVKGMRSKMSVAKTTATQIATTTSDAIDSKASTFQRAGVALMTRLAAGITSRKSAVTAAISSCISTAATSIRSKYSSFYSAGSYLVDGFAAGISAKTWAAEAKARAMANAAEQAARDALDINSPSKVFRALGYSVPEGFAMGIDKLSGMVVNSSTDMADTALYTVKDSISNIARAINADIDAQPTIRPVLDLSNVRSGASAIGTLFNSSPSVGLMTNVGAINSMMNRRSQNGVNDDVVSAIDKLRKDMGSMDRANYNINGVSVNEGTEVAEAIKVIVRAAKMDRRS